MDTPVITIDGPAGAGKSTVAKLLAKQLGFEFLDTGAMYRTVTLAVLRSGMSISDDKAVADVAENADIRFSGNLVLLNGEDVSKEIRTPKVAAAIGLVADNLGVRRRLTKLQREWTSGRSVVTEGRDQGTEVFPDSPCKIFLFAGERVRAERRQIELKERGIEMDLEDVLRQQTQRDEDDRRRPVGALRKADDALEVCTDGLSLAEVVEHLVEVVRERVFSNSEHVDDALACDPKTES